MFESLSQRLGDVVDRLTRRGALSEADVDAALREVRVVLLEADVALPVVKDFIAAVREKAVGEAVVKSVNPGHMVIKIVHDHLVETLGQAAEGLNYKAAPPRPNQVDGLKGYGQTATTPQTARRLKESERTKYLLATLNS